MGPQLTAAHRKRIVQDLKQGPDLGYVTSLWTAWWVADLIEHERGVKRSTVHTGVSARPGLDAAAAGRQGLGTE